MFKFSRWSDVSELSVSVLSLISSRQYYFEILHKQDDKGSDHVEVGVSIFLDFQSDSVHNNVFLFPVLVTKNQNLSSFSSPLLFLFIFADLIMENRTLGSL